MRKNRWLTPYWNTPDAGGGGAPAGGGAPGASGGGAPGAGGSPAGAGSGGQGGGTPGDGGAGGTPFPALRPNHDAGTPGGTPGGAGGAGGGTPEPWKEYVGAPEGGQYADITLPDGFTVEKPLLDKFTAFAAQKGLSQKAVQEFADFYAKEIVGPQSASFVEQISTWYDEVHKDAEIGGAKYEASVQNAERALSVFGTAGLKQLMVQYGIGNHPEVVRFFARVGSALPAEDNAGGGKPGAKQGTDFLTAMYGPADQYKR